MALNIIHVNEIPDCDLCSEPTPAPYDVKTIMGPWGNLCEEHFKTKGVKIGSKRELIKKRKVKNTFESVPVVRVPMSIDSVVTVKCPWCGQGKRVETDASYLVTCEGCTKPYKLQSQF